MLCTVLSEVETTVFTELLVVIRDLAGLGWVYGHRISVESLRPSDNLNNQLAWPALIKCCHSAQMQSPRAYPHLHLHLLLHQSRQLLHF